MVQIIQHPQQKSSSERFAQAIANLGESLGQNIPAELMGRQERSQYGKLLGEDVSQIRNPDVLRDYAKMAMQKKQQEEAFKQKLQMQQQEQEQLEKQKPFLEKYMGLEPGSLAEVQDPQILQQILKGNIAERNQTTKLRGDVKVEEENYNRIKEAFGDKFADVWKASPVGARTALEQAAIQQGLRNLPIGGLFGEGQEKAAEAPKKNVIKTPSGEDFELPAIETPENLTPKEKVCYQSSLRKENTPLFQESKSKLKGLKSEEDHLKILETLSSKVPEGMSRFFFTKDGNIRPLAQVLKLVPPEAERFVKTVNDFITGAKDIFGSRVTNYDIQIFKSRLPSLINSKEGRNQILNQMKIFNEMEKNYHKTLDQVYKKYGLGNISQEEAEQLASEIVAPREQELRAQLENVNIGSPEMIEQEKPKAENKRRSLEEIFG